jgi:hypothetical protein
MEPREASVRADEDTLNRQSPLVIECSLAVASALGVGLSEKIYEDSLAHEARKAGMAAVQQRGSACGTTG